MKLLERVKEKKPKIFLGGTCNNSTWRDDLIKLLKIDHFNPVVDDWNEEAQKREEQEREDCDFCLYVITPLMTGVFSIFEVADDSNKRPEKTIFCFLDKDEDKEFDKHQKKSLNQVGKKVEENGAKYFTSLEDVAKFVNKEENK